MPQSTDAQTITWKRSLEAIVGESVPNYLMKYVLPVAISSTAVAVLLQLMLGDILGGLAFLAYLIPVFLTFVVLIYPKMLADRQRIEIEERMNLFITYLGVMSTTDIARIEIFTTIAQSDEFGAIADEMNRIVKLVKTWNMSLDEAAQFHAKRTPSPILSDFLERMAYNIGAGQDLEEFAMDEQEIVMSEYETMYKGSLDGIDVLKDLFLSVFLSMSFIIVFASIIPVLVGLNPTILLLGATSLYVFASFAFLYATNTKMPNDPVWYQYNK
ncbi:MAG: type II secretion system F family protein, partial [Halobacteria archaeon]|nr:type II secretion system F family protein [Halobacteria archaeon]